MSNNVVSFEVSKTSNSFQLNKITAGKNIVNATLLDLQNVAGPDALMGYDDNINFSETGIQEYTLEELLAEGAETQADIQQKRAEEEARRLAEEQARILAEQQRLYEAEMAKLQEKYDELNDLYAQREANNGILHPIIEADIEAKIEALEKELELEHISDGWESILEHPDQALVAGCASVMSGIVDFGESIVDGGVQLLGGGIAELTEFFDPDLADLMREEIEAQVSYDASEVVYSEYLNWASDCGYEIEDSIAYGPSHVVGETYAKITCSLAIAQGTSSAAQSHQITATQSKAIMATTTGLSASGGSTEVAYQNGASYEEANEVCRASFVVGVMSGAAMEKVQMTAAGATTAKEVVKYTAEGVVVGTAEPLINSGVEYYTYGNNDGKTYQEYMEETGGWVNVAAGGFFGGINAGTSAYGGYKNVEFAKQQFVDEYGKSIYDIETDPVFQQQLISDYTMNPDSDYAILGKYKPTDDCFPYTDIGQATEIKIGDTISDGGATYFEYGNRATALEGGLGNEKTYELLNRPYLENVAVDKRLLLSTGPNSADWATGFYGEELKNVAQIYGYNSVDELAQNLKQIPVEIDGKPGYLWEVVPKS